MSARQRLQTKVAAKAVLAQMHEAVLDEQADLSAAPPVAEDGPEDAAASGPPPTPEELHAAWERSLKSDDFKLLSRSYLDYYESLVPVASRGDVSQWNRILDACKLTLLRFATLATKLADDSTTEEIKDEYVVYRTAVLLTSCTASLKLHRISFAVSSLQQLIQALWERFEGLGVGGRQNTFIVQPVRMLLGTLVDARMWSQAEAVVESIEHLIATAGESTSNEILPCPERLRADASVLPPFLRTRVYPCSEQVHSQAAGMGLVGRYSQDVRLNLRVIALRFRAMYSDSSRPNHHHLTATTWMTIVNTLSAQEDADVTRPGFYSLEILPDAAEALTDLNYLQPAAALLRRYEEFFQPIAQVRAGNEVRPIDLLKLPYEQHMQVVDTHGRLLIKYAAQIDSSADVPLPPQWPTTNAAAVARYTEYYLILHQRMLSQHDLDNCVQSLSTQSRDLAFSWSRPWDALKKVKEGLATLEQMYGPPESSPRQAWAQLHTLYAREGTILSEVVSPPQLPGALAAFAQARAVLLKHHAGLKDAQKVVVLGDARAHIHALIAQLVSVHLPTPQSRLAEDLRELATMQQEYLSQYRRQKTALLGPSANSNESVELIDAEVRAACVAELEREFAADSTSTGAAADSRLETITPVQSHFLRSSYLLTVLERLIGHVSSGASAAILTPDLHRLARIDSDVSRRALARRLDRRAQEQRSIAARAAAFARCSSLACRRFHAPPTTAFQVCSACRAAAYCSRPCQQAHWTTHKPMCRLKVQADVSNKAAEKKGTVSQSH